MQDLIDDYFEDDAGLDLDVDVDDDVYLPCMDQAMEQMSDSPTNLSADATIATKGASATQAVMISKSECAVAAAESPAKRTRIGSKLWLAVWSVMAFVAFLVLSPGTATHSGKSKSASIVSAAASPAGIHAATAEHTLITKRIDEFQAGDQVLISGKPVDAPDLSLGERVDPPAWRKLTLLAPKKDGTTCEVELLRPLTWLEQHNAKVGGAVHISVPECGIDGNAEILFIGPCPEMNLKSPKHRVVTGVFRHQAAAILELSVEGLDEPIQTTVNHPFWSEDRYEFVRADQLTEGERLRNFDGNTTTLLAARMLPGKKAVFNLEVHRDHVYHVGKDGVLVHNGTGRCTLLHRFRKLATNAAELGETDLKSLRRKLLKLNRSKKPPVVLNPNSTYKIGDQVFTTNKNGQVSSTVFSLTEDSLRVGSQRIATKYDTQVIGNLGLRKDVGFHLLGDQFKGSKFYPNIIPGSGRLNDYYKGAFGSLENVWKEAVQNGKRVDVKIDLGYGRWNLRPNRFRVSVEIDGKAFSAITLANNAQAKVPERILNAMRTAARKK